jgi:hypothetical protein
MAHTAAKLQNDAAYELEKAKATDPNLPYSTRAGAAVNAAGDAVASTYHSTMAAVQSENPAKDNVSAAGHAVREAEHTVKGKMNELERKNAAAPTGDRAAAGAREAGEKIAAKYHEGMKNAESSI